MIAIDVMALVVAYATFNRVFLTATDLNMIVEWLVLPQVMTDQVSIELPCRAFIGLVGTNRVVLLFSK